jgi:glycerol-3-phosphate acyltransferase PlsX
MSEMKEIYSKGLAAKISAMLVKKSIYRMKSRLDPDSVGGTMLLGISKPVIKAHGSSNATAICSAIRQAAIAADANVASRLQTSVARMTVDKAE